MGPCGMIPAIVATIGVIYWGLYWDNGKESRSYHSILRLYLLVFKVLVITMIIRIVTVIVFLLYCYYSESE